MTGWTKLGPDGDEPRRPLALHWDGRAWTIAALPDGHGELSGLTRWNGGLLAVGDTFSPASPSVDSGICVELDQRVSIIGGQGVQDEWRFPASPPPQIVESPARPMGS